MTRGAKSELKGVNFFQRMLIGVALALPSSSVKCTIYRLLGAKIGKSVYLGPGVAIIAPDYRRVTLADRVFVSPKTWLKVDLLEIGEGTHVGYDSLVVGGEVRIGKGCNMNNRVFLESQFAPLTIGDDVVLAASVIVSTHDGSFMNVHDGEMRAAPIVLEDRCFIGNGAILLPGVRVGTRSIIGAGSVVTKDVPNNVIALGSPARVIKKDVGKDK